MTTPGAITVYEAAEGPKLDGDELGESRTATRTYIITGTTDEAAALDALAAFTGSTFESTYLTGVSIEMITDNWWKGTTTFALPPSGGGGGGGSGVAEETFEIASTTVNVKIGIPGGGTGGALYVTRDFWAPLTANPDNDFIGVDKTKNSCEIKGVDILQPTMSFSFSKAVSLADWPTFKAAAIALASKTNNATWLEYDAECVLFNGLSARRDGGFYPVTMNFLYRPKSVAYTLNGKTIPAIAGWHYLDIMFKDEPDLTAGVFVFLKKPSSYTVRRVYYTGDFDTIYDPTP